MNSKMIFEVVFKVLVVVALGVVITLQLDTQEKIVYVDSIRLLSKYKGMEVARKNLQNRSQNWQSNMDTLQREVNKAMAELQQGRSKASAKEISLMQEVVQSKQQQLMQYQQTVKEQYQKEDEAMSKNLLAKVNDYIRRYGEKNNYTIILAATHYGNIAYADKAKDITEDVLVGLNQEFAKVK